MCGRCRERPPPVGAQRASILVAVRIVDDVRIVRAHTATLPQRAPRPPPLPPTPRAGRRAIAGFAAAAQVDVALMQKRADAMIADATAGKLRELQLVNMSLTNLPESVGNITSLRRLNVGLNRARARARCVRAHG